MEWLKDIFESGYGYLASVGLTGSVIVGWILSALKNKASRKTLVSSITREVWQTISPQVQEYIDKQLKIADERVAEKLDKYDNLRKDEIEKSTEKVNKIIEKVSDISTESNDTIESLIV